MKYGLVSPLQGSCGRAISLSRGRHPVNSPAERTDRSPWNWLLLVPIIIPLLTFLYEDREPRLFGFPRFYWLQLAYVGLGVLCTAIVYRMTKRKP